MLIFPCKMKVIPSKQCINAECSAYHQITITTEFISSFELFGLKTEKREWDNAELTPLTQILHNVLDVSDEVVKPVAVSRGRQVRFAVASHVHSNNTELALKLPQLVSPWEPDEEMGNSSTLHRELSCLIKWMWLQGDYGFILLLWFIDILCYTEESVH